MPSQEDRLLAVCAHLGLLVGFWYVAPIAIYAIKRKESAFVSFHALQAIVAQIVFGAALVVGGIAFTILGVVLAAASHDGAIAAAITVFVLLLLGIASVGLVVVHCIAAYNAWQGRIWSIPLAGGIARTIQGADEGALKA
jgi:uncharacterized Tic20 family protein